MRYPDLANPQRGSAFLQQRADGQLVLYGKYVFLQQLGKGTFSKVVEALDISSDHRVAIKIFRACERYREACVDELHILDRLRAESAACFATTGRDYRTSFLGHIGHEFQTSKPKTRGTYRRDRSVTPQFDDHCAIVFPLAGPSLLDVIKMNETHGMPVEMVRSVVFQILTCLQLCHKINIVHTDVKPENILFLSRDVIGAPGCKLPVHSAVTLIDFGNAVDTATFQKESHNARAHSSSSGQTEEILSCLSRKIIQTRHYRAPEVIFGSGWSTPADLWSVGCLIPELLTGKCLFMVHRDDEHLAMMERVLGRISRREMDTFANGDAYRTLVDSSGRLRVPSAGRDGTKNDMDKLARLEDQCESRRNPELLDLVRKLLQYDPKWRCTAAEALGHPFFMS
jgi:dual-specificity kinase